MEEGPSRNSQAVGRLLASLGLPLFANVDGGLLLVEDGRVRPITTAKELLPLLFDHLSILVFKNGKFSQDKPADNVLNAMLRSRSFLSNFETIQHVVTTPIVLTDFQQSRPGYNNGGILFVGNAVSTGTGLECIEQFLEVMDFQENADRTNAVAAMLTVPFRYHFLGGKPLVLVTSTRSHSGKGTLVECVRGRTRKAEIAYQDQDWPMNIALFDQLKQNPEIGVISFDNVRMDSSGSAKIIRSAFLESFITNSEVVLSSTRRSEPIRVANHFLVVLNTNDGALSVDLLNRSLPIRLCPKGDLSERIAKAKSRLGCDVKHQWLPTNRDRIESELWGMIARWVAAGRPLDETVDYPMGPWAQTIGGILQVNGFRDFLANCRASRTAADPVRQALGILAYHAANAPKRAGELAGITVREGLAQTLLPRTELTNLAARQRRMGVTLAPYIGDTIVAVTPVEEITYRLERSQGRFGERTPHYRYTFAEIDRVAANEHHWGSVVECDPCDTAGSVLANCHSVV